MVKYVLIALLFACSLASHPIGHVFGGKVIYYGMQEPIKEMNLGWSKPVLVPVSLMAGHILQDKFIGEAGLGDWQVEIGIVRVVIGYMLTPEKEREDYIYYAFWSLLPDIIDKGLGTNYFHRQKETPIISFTRDQNELIDELILASMIVKF